MYDPQRRLEELKNLNENGLLTKEEYIDLRNKEYMRSKGTLNPYIPQADATTPPQKSQRKKRSPFVMFIIWGIVIYLFNAMDEVKVFFAELFSIFS